MYSKYAKGCNGIYPCWRKAYLPYEISWPAVLKFMPLFWPLSYDAVQQSIVQRIVCFENHHVSSGIFMSWDLRTFVMLFFAVTYFVWCTFRFVLISSWTTMTLPRHVHAQPYLHGLTTTIQPSTRSLPVASFCCFVVLVGWSSCCQ